MRKDRGAEQGDVDGPLECSLDLVMVAAEARGPVPALQASGGLPWISAGDFLEIQRLQGGDADRLQSQLSARRT